MKNIPPKKSAPKKPRPSRFPQNCSEHCWYYEWSWGLDVVTYNHGSAAIHRIPWRILLRSARRCGKIK